MKTTNNDFPVIPDEDYNDGYYHFGKDVEDYPDCWCYVVWSKRGPGKTYSGLWYPLRHHFPIAYLKRTVKDVNFIMAKDDYSKKDKSPYYPINRDKLTNIKPIQIAEGVGAFYNMTEEDEPTGEPVSLLLALSVAKGVKGFDMSECEWMLLDEFIPQAGEIVRKAEGEMILDLYMTMARDRVKRGRKPLKLVLFANAEEISTPITNTLDIVDDMAEMNATGETKRVVRGGIFLHHITDQEFPVAEEEKSGIYLSMLNTPWGRKTFLGEFANNDFTSVGKMSLKGMSPFCHIHYNSKDWYIYLRESDGMYYCCESKQKCTYDYDLDTENDQRRYYQEMYFEIRNSCTDGRAKFLKYSMYDLLVKNYKKFFTL